MKAVIANLEDVPEAVRGDYEKGDDGVFRLKVEGELPGFVPRAQLEAQKRTTTEMRDTNLKLLQGLGVSTPEEGLAKVKAFEGMTAEQLTKLKAINPAEYEQLKAAKAALEQAGVANPNDLNAAIQAAVGKYGKEVVEPLKASLENETRLRREAEERAANKDFDTEFSKLLAEAGMRTDAREFLLNEARKDFQPKDGLVVARDGKFSKEDPGKALSPQEWIDEAMKRYGFAFKSSGGSGGGGGRDGGALPPGVTVLKNPTPAELGKYAKEIATGKMRVVRTN